MSALPDGIAREALIDVSAIAANTRRIARVTETDVIAVVKADAYGHGAVRSARAALEGGATHLGTADIAEALELRRAGVMAPIISWLHAPGASFDEAAAAHIALGISSMDQLQAAAAAATADRPTRIHLKLETGLSRNGIAPGDWNHVVAEAARWERLGKVTVEGIFSHVSNTSLADDLEALGRFNEGVAAAATLGVHPQIRHIAATNAALALPAARLDAVRIGIGLYGLSPFDDRTSADLGLRPAMTLRAAVANVRRVPAGTGLSYGYTHRTTRETTLALVPLGYADGVPRSASSRGTVAIAGKTFTVSGRIAMDQFIVDVGDHPVSVGDEAILFGDPTLGVPSAEDWASAADTINYEIITRIGARVTRRSVSS
ncbi:alanine racemase [Microbacterium sp. NC79]|uniref:alanine racemase n=1 Tax=Microbacterium sp. NC79 TaxID=2851009 RepID=UPI001C2BDD34|nr:alanine racemase [Microbacterium sp. NC79]MBV0894148.1 alanine racemase [Microbacterium sp. NC79]